MEDNSSPSAGTGQPEIHDPIADQSVPHMEAHSEGDLLAEWSPEIKQKLESDQASSLPERVSASTEGNLENAQLSEAGGEPDPRGRRGTKRSKTPDPQGASAPGGSEAGLSPVEHARQQALAIFDFTRPLHELSDSSRRVLESAALLHDTPLPPTRKKPLRAARELVRSQYADEFNPDESKVLAAVLAYHRGKIRRKHFDQLDLSPVQQREALTIAAILRIATGLNASGSGSTSVTQVDLGRDEMWIVVDGPQSDVDAPAAQHDASLWVKIGYPEVRVMGEAEAAAIRVPFPEPTENIGILPEDAMSEAGRKVMLFNFARMLSYEEGTRKGEDIEALHDMRVATRRMRASFEVFGEAFERRALKSHLAGLRHTGRLLGAVRDLDVFMEKALQYEGTLPEDQRNVLEYLVHTWQEQREEARKKMIEFFNSPEYFTFKRDFNIFLHTPEAGRRSLPMDQPVPDLVREVAPMMIYTRLAAVRCYDAWLVDAPIERLHALRIEFKKLRYTVEYFREVLGPQVEQVIEELKTIQDHLGDLTDAQVAIDILRKFVDDTEANQVDLPIEQRVNLQPVVTYLAYRHDERHRLMVTFDEVWRHFNRKELRKRVAQAVSVL